jgi:predicted hotdog family 3-hydroxylacyl-ACP dehydratase
MNFGMTGPTNLNEIDVLTLLPQRRPFVMIDHLTHCDQVLTTTTLEVREDNLFVEGDQLNPCALVENIAQTCAARMGYINKYVYQGEVKLGFIGGIKNFCLQRPAVLGETLTTTIEVIEEVMQMILVNAYVRVGDETIATAEMKIAQTDIEVGKSDE